jgi:hypothetical protein
MSDRVLSYEEIMAMYAESAKKGAEFDARLEKTRELMEANAKETREILAESSKKVDAQIAETSAQQKKTEALVADMAKQFKTTRSEVAGMGFGNGRFAENAMFDSVNVDKVFAGVQFDDIKRGMGGDDLLPTGKIIRVEFDVVLLNGTAAAIIEAKYRVRRKDLMSLIFVDLPTFRRVFPQYKDFKIYLGLGGMSFDDDVEEEALIRGVATLKFDGSATVKINDKDAKAWE